MDLPLIKQCLHELSETGKTSLPIYDFTQEKRSDETEAVDLQGGVCIVEGIHALNPELTSLVPGEEVYRIYAGLREEYCIDGRRVINTQDIRLCRRTLRDAAARGRSPEKDPCYVGPGDGRRDAVYQGLQDHGGLFAGHFLHLRAGPHRPAFCRRCAASSCWRAITPSCGTRRPAASSMWHPLPLDLLPADSMLREFYGGEVN